MNLLLLSNSTNFGDPYLFHAKDVIASFLTGITEVLFIPYAGVTLSYDDYETKVQESMKGSHIQFTSIHHHPNPKEAVLAAEAVAVGGGNTFQLLATLQKLELMEIMKDKVSGGMPYVGWSAGSNIAGPTICTSNDMPIIEPISFVALNFVPFQINPHYTEKVIPNHGGESRQDRLREYVELNPKSEVLCMPEGTWFELKNNQPHMGGQKKIMRLLHGQELEEASDETYQSAFASK